MSPSQRIENKLGWVNVNVDIVPDEQDPILTDSGCTSCFDVARLIADEDRARQVEVEVPCRSEDQLRLGFATLTVTLRRVRSQRVMGTGVYPVDNESFLGQRREQKGVNDHHVRLRCELAANHSLIGDDDQRGSSSLGNDRGVQDEVDQLEVTRLDDVAVNDTPIQDTVAIQHQRRSGCPASCAAYVTKHR